MKNVVLHEKLRSATIFDFPTVTRFKPSFEKKDERTLHTPQHGFLTTGVVVVSVLDGVGRFVVDERQFGSPAMPP